MAKQKKLPAVVDGKGEPTQINIWYEDGCLRISIPCTEASIRSSPYTKKWNNKKVASTMGFVPVEAEGAPSGMQIGLNLIAHLTDEERAKANKLKRQEEEDE